MTAAGTVLTGALAWVVGAVLFPLKLRWRRNVVRDIAAGRLTATPAGEGALRTHRTASMFEFLAVCGQPVTSVGGPGERTTCRACARLWKRGQAQRTEVGQ